MKLAKLFIKFLLKETRSRCLPSHIRYQNLNVFETGQAIETWCNRFTAINYTIQYITIWWKSWKTNKHRDQKSCQKSQEEIFCISRLKQTKQRYVYTTITGNYPLWSSQKPLWCHSGLNLRLVIFNLLTQSSQALYSHTYWGSISKIFEFFIKISHEVTIDWCLWHSDDYIISSI